MVGAGDAFLTCAPSFGGNENVKNSDMRLEQVSLSEALVASGYGVVGDLAGLTPEEADRLTCAQGVAQYFRWGYWSREGARDLSSLPVGNLAWQGPLYRYDPSIGLVDGLDWALRCACGTNPVTKCDPIRLFASERVDAGRLDASRAAGRR
jgi:hypothetical protein